MNEIRLFVSGYKRHFLISAQQAAEALFRALNKELHVTGGDALGETSRPSETRCWQGGGAASVGGYPCPLPFDSMGTVTRSTTPNFERSCRLQERRGLGRAGMTRQECAAAFVHGQEKALQRLCAPWLTLGLLAQRPFGLPCAGGRHHPADSRLRRSKTDACH